MLRLSAIGCQGDVFAGPEGGSAADDAEAGLAGDGSSDGGASACVGDHLHVNPANAHCYRYDDLGAPWNAAETDCVIWGGHLATIGDSSEQAFVYDLITSERPDAGTTWIGLNRIASPDWHWTSGEPFAYARWGPGNPDDGGSTKDCVVVLGGTAYWDNIGCGGVHPAVCER